VQHIDGPPRPNARDRFWIIPTLAALPLAESNLLSLRMPDSHVRLARAASFRARDFPIRRSMLRMFALAGRDALRLVITIRKVLVLGSTSQNRGTVSPVSPGEWVEKEGATHTSYGLSMSQPMPPCASPPRALRLAYIAATEAGCRTFLPPRQPHLRRTCENRGGCDTPAMSRTPPLR